MAWCEYCCNEVDEVIYCRRCTLCYCHGCIYFSHENKHDSPKIFPLIDKNGQCFICRDEYPIIKEDDYGLGR